MSERDLLSKFRRRVSGDPYDSSVEDDQVKAHLRESLAILSDAKPIENHEATVQIVSGSINVVLPPDFRMAEEIALLAVEYGFSQDYCIDLQNYGANRPVAAYNTKLRYLSPIPKPQQTEQNVYGVSRKVLKLHASPNVDREETLVYWANYWVEDDRAEITLKENLTAGTTVVITVRTGSATTVYTYTAVSTTPGANEFKVGLSALATARNLKALVNANTGTTGLVAENIGQMVRVTGSTADVDFTVTSASASISIEALPAYSNMDSAVETRVLKLMESQYYDYLGTDPAMNGIISDQVRALYLQKAERLREQALDRFQLLTI